MTLMELARKLRPIIEQAMQNVDDTTALDAITLFPEWKPNTAYTAGSRIRHDGVLYHVLQTHRSQDGWIPINTPSLFAKVLIPDINTVPAWEQPDSTNGYTMGDRVVHNNNVWESLVDHNVWEPGAVGTESLWKEILDT